MKLVITTKVQLISLSLWREAMKLHGLRTLQSLTVLRILILNFYSLKKCLKCSMVVHKLFAQQPKLVK